jgi:hypothetical protein
VRLEDRVAADKSREKADRIDAERHVATLAGTLKRARRECELAEFQWRRNPSADNLTAARAAQHARNAAEVELRELCLNDERLYADVQYRFGLR